MIFQIIFFYDACLTFELVKLLSYYACLMLSGMISDDMLCAGAPGKDACQANHYFLIFHLCLVQKLNP